MENVNDVNGMQRDKVLRSLSLSLSPSDAHLGKYRYFAIIAEICNIPRAV